MLTGVVGTRSFAQSVFMCFLLRRGPDAKCLAHSLTYPRHKVLSTLVMLLFILCLQTPRSARANALPMSQARLPICRRWRAHPTPRATLPCSAARSLRQSYRGVAGWRSWRSQRAETSGGEVLRRADTRTDPTIGDVARGGLACVRICAQLVDVAILFYLNMAREASP